MVKIRRRFTAFAVLIGVAPTFAGLATSSPVVAAPVLAPGVVDAGVSLSGHGWGHGYGLSQWGAYGYAVDHGWTASQILDHYYGGTVAGTVPLDTVVAVRLQSLDGAQTAAVSESGGLRVDGVAGGPWKSVLAREVAPSTYRVWARSDAQVCPSSAEDPATTGWTVVADSVAGQVNIRTQADSSNATSYADLAAVCEPGGKVRSYRGLIRAVNDTAGGNRTVNEVPLEHYLRAVIAKEMSPSWATAGGGRGAQALQAQAVAARSYALAENRYSYARTCDLVCQYYMGAAVRSSVSGAYTRVEYPDTDAAVLATAGVVRRVGNTSGAIAYTMFSASSGGWTMPGTGGLLPFPAVVDEGDDTPSNPNYSWSTTLAGSTISAKYPAIGTFTSLTVLARNGYGDWGGRVTSLRITGSAGSVTVTGDVFKSAMGLKSNWFTVNDGSAPATSPGSPAPPSATPADAPSTPAGTGCNGRTAPSVTGVLTAASAARYTPLAPVRLVDTRLGLGTSPIPLGAGCTLVVTTGLGVTATAAAVNITAIEPAAGGFVTAYSCGVERPTVSVVQAVARKVVAGMAVVPLGSGGKICVYSSVAMEVVVDLFGSYTSDSGVSYEPMAATRLYDSRSAQSPLPAGTMVRIPVVRSGGAPAGAAAAALTVHATNAVGAGYVTVYPCSASMPVVSSLNTVSGSSVTNHVEVVLNGAGEVCVYISTAMHVVVDLSGWFGVGATTRFYAVPPFRAVDTRMGTGLSGAFATGADRAVTLAGSGGLPASGTLRAVMAEVTAVDPSGAGYVTIHPCLNPVPGVSMVRYVSGANSANVVASPDDGSGRWCITASAAAHVLVDVSGYFA